LGKGKVFCFGQVCFSLDLSLFYSVEEISLNFSFLEKKKKRTEAVNGFAEKKAEPIGHYSIGFKRFNIHF
jgi:hypothetical protein